MSVAAGVKGPSVSRARICLVTLSLSLIAPFALSAGCVDRHAGDGGDEIPDLYLPPPDLDSRVPCDEHTPCPSGGRCHLGWCIPDNGLCANDDQCANDSYCDCPIVDGSDGGGLADGGATCTCVPWDTPPRSGWDPACREPPFDIDDVTPPAILCTSNMGAETTVVVADLDGDGRTEILYTDVGYGFHAIHGDDCSPVFDQMFGFSEWNASQLAVADLDGDGKAEIIGIDRTHRGVIFDAKGNLLAGAQIPYEYEHAEAELGGPAIVDVDNHAPPEIVMGGQVLRYTPGTNKTMPTLKEVWQHSVDLPYWGSLTIAADLDGDRRPEVIAGKQIFRGADGMDATPMPLQLLDGPGAYAAVADFNKDKKPDLVLAQSGAKERRLSIYDYANGKFLFGPLVLAEPWGSAPTVADFDGDGQPEVAVAGSHDLTIYDLECTASPRPGKCDQGVTPGILWRKSTQDLSSGSSAAVAFDMNGDGAAEAIYRDECWMRVYDGKTGKTLFAVSAPSATGVELPVVADVDGDGHAEIIVTATGFPQCTKKPEPDTGTPWTGDSTVGILVLSDPRHRWMPARPLWNQHGYHITNIEDDLSVPAYETPIWESWNNFRGAEQGIAGSPAGIADFTARVPHLGDGGPMDCATRWTLYADLCNRGAGVAQKGVKGSFYLKDPRMNADPPLCIAQTKGALKPGACETVSCDWQMPSTFRTDLWFRANDDGTVRPPREECRADNDLLFLKGASCKNLQ